MFYLFLFLTLLFSPLSFAATEVRESGSSKGYVNVLDFYNSTVSVAGIVGTVTPTGGGGGGVGVGTINPGSNGRFAYYVGQVTVDDNPTLTTDGTNIGIGTVTPGVLLDVRGNVGIGTDTNRALLQITGDGAKTLFRVNDSGQNDTTPIIINSGGNLGIGTSTSSKAICVGTGCLGAIDSTGNLTVATVTQSGAGANSFGGQVSVTGLIDGLGNFRLRGGNNIIYLTTDNMPKIEATTDVGTTADIKVTVNSTERLRIAAAGNVGISSAAPGTALDVTGTTRTTGFQLNLAPLAGGNVLVSNSVGVGTWMPPSTLPSGAGGSGTVNSGTINQVAKYAATGTVVSGSSILTENGTNVGIGSTAPVALLDVQGNVGIGTVSPAFTNTTMLEVNGKITVTGGNAAFRVIDNTDEGPILRVMYAQSTQIQEAFGYTDNRTGNFLVDDQPYSALFVANRIGGAATNIQFYNDSTGPSTMTLSSGKNVGIGTTFPKATLDVLGTFRSSLTDDNIWVGSSSNLTAATAVPNCIDTGGNHLNYTTATNSISCGTSSSGGGAGNWTSQAYSSGNGNVGIYTLAPVGIGTTLQVGAAMVVMPTAVGDANVGIGTWKPAALLHVAGPGDNFFGTNVGIGTNQVQVNALGVQGGVMIGSAAYTGRQSPTLGLGVSGNVGIGTWTAINTLDNAGEFANGTYAGQKLILVNDMVTSGNLGVGTWAPTSTLSVAAGGAAVFTVGSTGIITTTVAAGALTMSAANPTILATSATAGSALGITGSAAATGGLTLQSTSASGTSDYIKFIVGNAGATEGGRFSTSGNLGLGTVTPNARLGIVGNIGIGTLKNTNYVLTAPPNGGMIIEGNVGIGTHNPQNKLNIGGTLGWSVKAGANTACSTTCPTTSSCVFGFDTGLGGSDLVDCSDASADRCVCAGP